MATVRLAPGVALVTVPGHGLAVRTPDGAFLRVDTGAADQDALVAQLTRGCGDDTELARLTAAFADAGFLARTDDIRAPLNGRTVVLLGDPVLTEPLARFVRAEGGEVRHAGPDDLGGTGPSTAVVWCLDSPVPNGLWDEADRLPARGTCWLRCHREGATVWTEPFAAATGDVTSADVRLRRLAATPAHRELAAYWAGSRTDDTGPAHNAASAALTASLITADLIAWAAGRPGGRRLRRVDVRDLTVTEHPVLPVPAVAPLDR
ncbi:hypothetical protein [Streptomyces peucetius]|uniref:Uncharacterized protein n=1 Tax=Streptomyces peucetius TaxID=1950 RepID=A0ABY6IE51_STRPE|nr:hypothetical protein [Streptomyces peucetius]UYQ65253.1 hypothetical protein OGH68_29840 [Streptomyces peucetius]